GGLRLSSVCPYPVCQVVPLTLLVFLSSVRSLPAVLLSFPTRRSSDLCARHLARPPPQHPAGPPRAPPRKAARRPPGTPDPPRGRDRKSTRLNSSHGSISYAVFCLKKKKTTN